MKLVINRGTTVKSAIEQISDFLESNYASYPVLKSNMNVYITLDNSNGQVCPDNEKEFVISANGVKDTQAEMKKRALKKALDKWQIFYNHCKSDIKSCEANIQRDVNYLETAKEKERKAINIEKRKLEFEKNTKQLEKSKGIYDTVRILDKALEEHKCLFHFFVSTGRNKYQMSMECVLVWEDIEGYTCHFTHGKLRDGKPNW